jgi:hypothetical protein
MNGERAYRDNFHREKQLCTVEFMFDRERDISKERMNKTYVITTFYCDVVDEKRLVFHLIIVELNICIIRKYLPKINIYLLSSLSGIFISI